VAFKATALDRSATPPWHDPSLAMYERFDDDDLAQDYLLLLRRGSVMRRLAPTQHRGWRQAIRAKAHSDELRIRTWSRDDQPATVWAVLPDWSLTRDEHEELQRKLAWKQED
jgi:hypothetical protein